MAGTGTIKIKLIGSPICTPEKHKVIVRALGLKKMNRIAVRPAGPASGVARRLAAAAIRAFCCSRCVLMTGSSIGERTG